MFTINRKALADELSLLQLTAERKGTIPILSCVRMEVQGDTVTLIATDLDVSITTRLDADGDPWAGCVPLREFSSLVKLFDADNVGFNSKPNERIEIFAGRSRHLLPVVAVDKFPVVNQPEGSGLTINGPSLRNALDRTMFAADSESDSKYGLQGVNVSSAAGSLRFVATNGRHCAVVKVKSESELETPTTIPTRACVAILGLLGEGDVELIAGAHGVAVKTDRRALVSRIVDSRFPDWTMFIPKTLNHRIEADARRLESAIKRTAITSRELALVKINLKFTLSKDEILIESRGGEGESSEPVTAESSLNGDKFEIGMNGEHWLKFLAKAEGSIVCQFNNVKDQIVLSCPSDPNYTYVTMPVKL